MSSELGMTGLDQGWCAKTNMPSVKAHPAIIQQFIDSELREGHMFGPFAPEEIQYPKHIAVIEKKNQPGKFRLIL